MLTIVTTHYKEDWETSHWLFDSLAIQRGIDFKDFEVIVVNDGSNVLEIPKYPFSIRQIAIPHGGVSKARNVGLKNAQDYVMFCDIDDMFLNNYGLHLIMEGLKEEPEVIISAFCEEVPDNKLVQHDCTDSTFVHGKVFKTSFLKEKDLKFCDELTIHEDGYFICLCLTEARNKKNITTPIYLWRWNDNSVVRKDRTDFLLRTYPNLIDARMEIIEQLRKRGYKNEYLGSITKTVCDVYYDFQLKEHRNADEKLQKKAIDSFLKFWRKYKKEFMSVSGDMLGEFIYLSRMRAYKQGFRVEKETLTEFIKKIEG